MIQIAPIPEALKTEAEKRTSQWLEALGTAYSGDMEQVRRILCGSDYLYHWAKRQPQWLVEALATDLSSLSAHILTIQQNLDTSWPEYEVKQFLRHQRHYWSMQIAVVKNCRITCTIANDFRIAASHVDNGCFFMTTITAVNNRINAAVQLIENFMRCKH